MRSTSRFALLSVFLSFGCTALIAGDGAPTLANAAKSDHEACSDLVDSGFRPIARNRNERFLGKVQPDTAQCRGGAQGMAMMSFPWLDWQMYWGTADDDSRSKSFGANFPLLGANSRGVFGALLDLEYQ